MTNYNELAQFILTHVGGKENIENLTHCLTRLRFKLKDDTKVDQSVFSNRSDIITTQFAGGKFQVVIGVQVGDVYEACLELLEVQKMKATDEEEKNMSLMDKFTSMITQIMTPVLGVLKVSMIMAIVVLFVSFGWITRDDGAFVVFRAIGYSVLTFFPIILGYTCSKAFKINPFVGMVLGGILVYPGLSESLTSGPVLYTLLEGTPLAMPIHSTFFGIPILFPESDYTSTVIPIILVTWFASKVQKFLNVYLTKYLKEYFMDMFVILIAGVAAILLVGPVAVLFNNILEICIDWLLLKSKFLSYAIITLIYQPAIIFGLHWPIITIAINRFMTTGLDFIGASLFTANFAHLAVCFAVYLRTKSKKMKATCVPAMIASLNCIVEPSIYGVTLPVKKRFLFCMIGGAIGGTLIGVLDACEFAWVSGITGFVGFVDPNTGSLRNLWIALFATAITMIISFALTWFTWDPKDDKGDDIETETQMLSLKKEILYSAFDGKAKPLEEMSDKAFAAMGKGICITPESGQVVSPCAGIVSIVFDDGHAIVLTSNKGAEVIIHIGTDTLNLKQGTFQVKVKQGDIVEAGDELITFDLENLKDANMESAIIVTNSAKYLDVLETGIGAVKCGDEILVTVASGDCV